MLPVRRVLLRFNAGIADRHFHVSNPTHMNCMEYLLVACGDKLSNKTISATVITLVVNNALFRYEKVNVESKARECDKYLIGIANEETR